VPQGADLCESMNPAWSRHLPNKEIINIQVYRGDLCESMNPAWSRHLPVLGLGSGSGLGLGLMGLGGSESLSTFDFMNAFV